MNVTIYPHKGGYIELTDEGITNATTEGFQIINNDLKKAHIIGPKTKLSWRNL